MLYRKCYFDFHWNCSYICGNRIMRILYTCLSIPNICYHRLRLYNCKKKVIKIFSPGAEYSITKIEPSIFTQWMPGKCLVATHTVAIDSNEDYCQSPYCRSISCACIWSFFRTFLIEQCNKYEKNHISHHPMMGDWAIPNCCPDNTKSFLQLTLRITVKLQSNFESLVHWRLLLRR